MPIDALSVLFAIAKILFYLHNIATTALCCVISEMKPPEAESFLALRRATDRENLYLLQYFQQSIIIR